VGDAELAACYDDQALGDFALRWFRGFRAVEQRRRRPPADDQARWPWLVLRRATLRPLRRGGLDKVLVGLGLGVSRG